jgi:hypothetical protein
MFSTLVRTHNQLISPRGRRAFLTHSRMHPSPHRHARRLLTLGTDSLAGRTRHGGGCSSNSPAASTTTTTTDPFGHGPDPASGPRAGGDDHDRHRRREDPGERPGPDPLLLHGMNGSPVACNASCLQVWPAVTLPGRGHHTDRIGRGRHPGHHHRQRRHPGDGGRTSPVHLRRGFHTGCRQRQQPHQLRRNLEGRQSPVSHDSHRRRRDRRRLPGAPSRS